MKETMIKPSRAGHPSLSNRNRTTASRDKAGLAQAESAPMRLHIKSILVPIDFSPSSKKALAYAVPFAEQFGARIILVHVVEPVAMPDFANYYPLAIENDKVMASCKVRLEQLIKERAIEPKLVEKTLVRHGRSFHEIADAARTLKADLIIISTHGYTGVKHALMGSTTERVVRHAPCPVLVVREREHDFA